MNCKPQGGEAGCFRHADKGPIQAGTPGAALPALHRYQRAGPPLPRTSQPAGVQGALRWLSEATGPAGPAGGAAGAEHCRLHLLAGYHAQVREEGRRIHNSPAQCECFAADGALGLWLAALSLMFTCLTPRYCVGILLFACRRLYLMLEAAHPRPEEVVEFSSHVDVKKRAQSLMRFKSGACFEGPARRLPMLQHSHVM